jgi:hypothetical protein
MYQAWLVQKFNGEPYNVVLGEHFETVEDAYDAINLYEQCFGKCVSGQIEPAGTPIATAERKRESLLQTILKLFT